MMGTLFNSNATCYHLYFIVGSLQGKPQIVLRFTFKKKKKNCSKIGSSAQQKTSTRGTCDVYEINPREIIKIILATCFSFSLVL